MKKLFNLPEEFEIHKKGFSKKTFLDKAKLTTNEKELIVKFVKSMNLIYDIRYHDGSEIILMDVELFYRQNRSTDIDVARVISTALPYNCITLIQNEKYARIVVFSKQQNTIQACRSVVCKQASTNIFDINKPSYGEHIIISGITDRLCSISSTANDVIDMCVDIIENNKKEHICDEVEEYSIEREILEEIKEGMDEGYDSESERNRDIVYIDYNIDEDFEPEEIEDSVYDYYEALEILSKEEILCDCAYTFYLGLKSRISELDWLLQYAKFCVEALSRLYSDYNVKLDFYRKLGAAFRTEMIVNPEDYLFETELELMQEMLYEEYSEYFNEEECDV